MAWSADLRSAPPAERRAKRATLFARWRLLGHPFLRRRLFHSKSVTNPNNAAGLERLADLIRERNANEVAITRIVGRPAQLGHIGEYIASRIFDIELEQDAAHRGSDGQFRSGPFEALGSGKVPGSKNPDRARVLDPKQLGEDRECCEAICHAAEAAFIDAGLQSNEAFLAWLGRGLVRAGLLPGDDATTPDSARAGMQRSVDSRSSSVLPGTPLREHECGSHPAAPPPATYRDWAALNSELPTRLRREGPSRVPGPAAQRRIDQALRSRSRDQPGTRAIRG